MKYFLFYMLTFFKKIFIWWNQDTFGTRLQTIFFGKLVGKDSYGNKYYQNKKGKRWVIYSDEIDIRNRIHASRSIDMCIRNLKWSAKTFFSNNFSIFEFSTTHFLFFKFSIFLRVIVQK